MVVFSFRNDAFRVQSSGIFRFGGTYLISGLSWPQPGSLAPSVAAWDPRQESLDQSYSGLGFPPPPGHHEEQQQKCDHPNQHQEMFRRTRLDSIETIRRELGQGSRCDLQLLVALLGYFQFLGCPTLYPSD